MIMNHGIYHPPSSIVLGDATVLLSVLVSFHLPFLFGFRFPSDLWFIRQFPWFLRQFISLLTSHVVLCARCADGGGGGGHGWCGGVLGFARKFKLALYLMCQSDSWFRVPVRIPVPQGTGESSSVYHTWVQYCNRDSRFKRLSNPVRSKWVCPFFLPWFYSIARVWPGIPSLACHWQK